MFVLESVKKFFWSIVIVVSCVGAWVSTILQVIRNFVREFLAIPEKALGVAAAFIGVAYSVMCFTAEAGIGTIILSVVGFILLLLLIFKLFSFVLALCYALVGVVLNIINFDPAVSLFTRCFQQAAYHLVALWGPNDPRMRDRIVFIVPWILHKINRLGKKAGPVIRAILYGASGIVGAYLSYSWTFVDVNEFAMSDYAMAWAMVVGLTAVSVWFAHCVMKAYCAAVDSMSEMEEVFSSYAALFRNAQKSKRGSNTHRSSGGSTESNKSRNEEAGYWQGTVHNENPFYELLGEARTFDELQAIYRNLAKKIHPDVCEDLTVSEATARMAELNNAFEEMKRRF